MNDWKEYKLGQIIDYVNRGVSPLYVEHEGIIILNQKCIRNGKIDLRFARKTSKEKRYTEEKELKKEDILINSTGVGTAGRVSIFQINENCFVDTHISIVRVNKNIALPKFIFYDLFRREGEIEGYAEGSTGQIELGREKIKDIYVKAPPLQEQAAIVEILSSLDDKIDLLHKQNETLEQLAETLFRQWFIEECEESWKEILIKEVSISNSETLRNNFTYSEIEYLDTGSITKGKIEAWQHFSKNERPSRAQRLVKPLDIIYSLVRPNHLHYGILLYPKVNSVVSTGFTVITATSISPYFLYYYLTSKDIVEYLSIIAEGSTSAYPSLRPSDIECLSFPRPPQEKVEKFHSLVNELWEKINLNQRQIKHLECTRDTLLPKLMSGEIRVNLAEV